MEDSSISLPDDVRAELDAAASTGGYPSSSELIRDLVRDYRIRRDEMIAALDEGLASGEDERSIQDIIADGRKRAGL